jgi:hypothetical protein
MDKGDILICKQSYCKYGSNIKGNKYIIRNIVVNGERNVNVYVSNEVGGSMPFSLYRDYDMFLSHSSLYFYDYFISLVDVRQKKLEQLGL